VFWGTGQRCWVWGSDWIFSVVWWGLPGFWVGVFDQWGGERVLSSGGG